jgi:GTP-binding protein EngB required for normal cell division
MQKAQTLRSNAPTASFLHKLVLAKMSETSKKPVWTQNVSQFLVNNEIWVVVTKFCENGNISLIQD